MNISKNTISLIVSTFVAIVHANAYSVSGSTYTTNGSDSDVQAAITASSAGATVVIPTGQYSWATGITCTKAIKIMGAAIGGVTINDNNTTGNLIALTPPSTGNLEFCNCNIQQGPGITVKNQQAFMYVSYLAGSPGTIGVVLLHDCTFTSSGLMFQHIQWAQNGGVIWNCTFYGGATGQGTNSIDVAFQFKNSGYDTWNTPSTMGTADTTGTANTYIEDCTFNTMILECINCDDGSRTVFRHNTFNTCPIGSHGQDTSPLGNRHWEIYNNTWTFDGVSNQQQQAAMRGGTGVIFDNVMPLISSENWGTKASIGFACLSCEGAGGRCYTNYPIPRQVGQSWSGGSGSYSYPQLPSDGSGYITDPVYVWGNTGTGNYNTIGYFDNTNTCGNSDSSATFIIAGRDVLYGQAKPGYTPYTYPHPLRTVSSAPLAPQNLRVTGS